MAGQGTWRFIEKLASDDALRAEVERDPVGTLKAHGIHVDPSKVPAGGVTLPSKETLQGDLDEHVARMQAPMGIVIFMA
ncbi:hypothetical protein ACLESD_00185 [Pyxidicoccus sp. 3LFB2]